jgi:histidyl-tRNA synthetase
MRDLLPKDHLIHQHINSVARSIGKLYGYEEVSTPILEYTKVFDRTLGDTSDVVSKEMYSFLDKSNDSIALRPEFTASIMRAYISNSLTHDLPLKYFSSGPLFRYDRPQAGRQRQFHQFNFENIGDATPYSDAEIIKLASHILTELEIIDDVTLELNSLGCMESRNSYEQALVKYFREHFDELSDESQKRLEKNPLRIFDSKNENDKVISAAAPMMEDFYTDSARDYFKEVKGHLDSLKVKYVINPRLVRGFDYYCHTAFEFTTTKLGAQSGILGGGRYNGLAKLMGGPDTPAIGFAAGIERIFLLKEYLLEPERSVCIIPIGQECLNIAITLADELRNRQIATNIDFQGKVPKRIQRAVQKNAKFAVFIGDEEIKSGKFRLKNLDTKDEKEISLDQLITEVQIKSGA